MTHLNLIPCPCVNAEERVQILRLRYPREKYLVAFDEEQYAGLLYGEEIVSTPRCSALDCLHTVPCLQENATPDAALNLMRTERLPALPVFSGPRFLGIIANTPVPADLSTSGRTTSVSSPARKPDPDDQGLSAMLSHLAHEVNNICACAGAGVEFLHDTWKNVTPILDRYHKACGDFHLGGRPYQQVRTQVQEIVDALRDSSTRVRDIIQKHRRYIAGDKPEAFRPISLCSVAGRAWALCRTRLTHYTSGLEFCLTDEELPILGDPVLLEQAIINLLLNAGQSLPSPEKKIRMELFTVAGGGQAASGFWMKAGE